MKIQCRRLLVRCLIIDMFWCSSGLAIAEEVAFGFEGTVFSIIADQYEFAIGDQLVGYYVYETNTPDIGPPNFLGIYNDAIIDVGMVFTNGYTASLDNNPDPSSNFIIVVEGDLKGSGRDSIALQGPVTGEPILRDCCGLVKPIWLEIGLFDNTGVVFSSDMLPTTLPPVSAFDPSGSGGYFTFGNISSNESILFKIDSLFQTDPNAPLACGNGYIDPDEDCDDGNSFDGDGCSSNCRFDLHLTKQLRTTMFIDYIGSANCDATAVIDPNPVFSYKFRLALYDAFCFLTDDFFNENPVEANTFEPLEARVTSVVNFEWTCEAGRTIPISGTVTPVASLGGPEPLGQVGVVNPIWVEQSLVKDGKWAFISSGRPASILEAGFQFHRPRTNSIIWHKLEGTVSCNTDANGRPTYELSSRFSESTRFPSHRSYLYEADGTYFISEIDTVAQDAFSNLWFLPPLPAGTTQSNHSMAPGSIGCGLTLPEVPNPVPSDFDFTPLAEQWCDQMNACGFSVGTCVSVILDALGNPIPDQVLPPADNSTLSTSFVVISGGDSDGDGTEDAIDNCSNTHNADQQDSDGDGFGNACDPDFNNDCVVNFLDFATMTDEFLSTNSPQHDLNSDGVVNFLDIGIFSAFFLMPPGPSGISSICDLP